MDLSKKQISELTTNKARIVPVNVSLQFVCCLVFVAVFSFPRVGAAEFTSQQQALYDDAKASYVKADYQTSDKLLSAAIALGPFDILFFGRGQARLKMGDCKGAKVDFEAAATAPSISQDVAAKAEAKLLEIRRVCEGSVFFACQLDGVRIDIDGDNVGGCGTEVVMPPGRYKYTAQTDAAAVNGDFEIVGANKSEVSVSFFVQPPEEASLAESPAPANRRHVAQWVVTGSGLALIGSAVAMDLIWVADRTRRLSESTEVSSDRQEIVNNSDALNTARTATLITAGVGIALSLTGLTWLLLSPSDADPIVNVVTDIESTQIVWSAVW